MTGYGICTVALVYQGDPFVVSAGVGASYEEAYYDAFEKLDWRQPVLDFVIPSERAWEDRIEPAINLLENSFNGFANERAIEALAEFDLKVVHSYMEV